MNEKIKNLAKIAKEVATSKDPFGEYDIGFDEKKFEQKFAELIIKECANIADEMEDIRCPYPGDAIVERFGLGEQEGAANWRSKD